MAAPDAPRRAGRGAALLDAFAPATTPPSTQRVLRTILWPVAIVTVLHRIFVLVPNMFITDDFGPVYSAVINFKFGRDVYTEPLQYVDPHYLYPPAATVLLAPFGYLPVEAARYWYVAINVVAILLAAWLLLRMFGFALSSVAAPALLLAMFCSESVINTLVFTNINGVMLLLEVLFLRWLLVGSPRAQWWAGVAIGLTFLVKPSLAPLLLLPLLSRQWRPIVAAAAVPLLANAAAWPLVADSSNFVTRTLPYILSTRDYFNSSIQGNGAYFGLPPWLVVALRLLFVALAAVSLWLLNRHYRERDPLMWLTTSSGVLLTTSWLVLSLGQAYYSMLLFPFLMTVVLRTSVIRTWPAWLGVYGFMAVDKWLLLDDMATGRFLDYLRVTYGWSLLMISVTAVLVFRWRDARADGRLADGIDPVWAAPARR